MSTKGRNPATQRSTVKRAIRSAYATVGSWRKVEALDEFFPVPHSTLRRMAVEEDYFPKKWEHRFGVQGRVLTDPCPECGEVHTTARCTKIKSIPKDLFSIKKDVLLYALENRGDY